MFEHVCHVRISRKSRFLTIILQIKRWSLDFINLFKNTKEMEQMF